MFIFQVCISCIDVVCLKVYRELRQSAIDMEAMFKLKEVIPKIQDSPAAAPIDWKGLAHLYIHTYIHTYINGHKHLFFPLGKHCQAAPSLSKTCTSATLPILTARSWTVSPCMSRQERKWPSWAARVAASPPYTDCCTDSTMRAAAKCWWINKTLGISLCTPWGRLNFSLYTVLIVLSSARVVPNILEICFSYLSILGRESFGVVPQDIVLFNETLGYNIGYGLKEGAMVAGDGPYSGSEATNNSIEEKKKRRNEGKQRKKETTPMLRNF